MRALVISFIWLFSLQAQAVSVKYYYGDVMYYSIEGKLQAGNVSLVKRTMDPAQNKISEYVIQPAAKENQPAEEYTVDMVRQTNNVFKMLTTNPANSSLTFYGKEWEWTNWNYQIVLNDGSTLSGAGLIGDRGTIFTNKTLSNRKPFLKIIERLSEISADEYDRLRDELLRSSSKKVQP